MRAGPFDERSRLELRRVGAVADVTLGKMLQSAPSEATDRAVPYLRAGSLGSLSELSALPEMYASARDVAHYAVTAGDLLVTEGGDVGKTAFVPGNLPTPTIIQNSLHRVRPRQGDGRFLRYAMDVVYGSGWLDVLCNRSTFGHLTVEKLSSIQIPWPELVRQQAVADYLDTETARIDALIAKKRKLAQSLEARFLEEARTLVVGGQKLVDALNVGQEELLPGWRSLKLGRHLRFGSGATPTSGDPRYYGPGVPWIVTGDLRDSELRPVDRSVTEAAIRDFSALKIHPAGSLIVAMYGATVGRLGLMTFHAAVNQACSVMEMRDGLDLKFLFFFLLTHRSALLERCVGAGQPNISQDILRSLRIPTPSLFEQRRIADGIEKSRARNGELVTRLGRQVTLLQEHRQALITAAVTGKLEIAGVAG